MIPTYWKVFLAYLPAFMFVFTYHFTCLHSPFQTLLCLGFDAWFPFCVNSNPVQPYYLSSYLSFVISFAFKPTHLSDQIIILPVLQIHISFIFQLVSLWLLTFLMSRDFGLWLMDMLRLTTHNLRRLSALKVE